MDLVWEKSFGPFDLDNNPQKKKGETDATYEFLNVKSPREFF